MTAILNRWSFRGYPLNRTDMRVREMTGALGVPPSRGKDFLTMGHTGQLFVKKIADSRRIGLELLLTGVYNPDAIRTYLDSLANLFADRSQGTLTHFHPDGTIRSAQAEVADWLPADSKAHIGALYLGVADFLLADPWFYTPSVVATGSIPTSGSTLTVTNPGTAYPCGPQGTLTLDLLGPITNPVIANGANGVSVTVNVVVAAGTHLVIDCVAFTALNNGVNAIGSVQHSGALPFMVLQPGANILTVTGTGTTGATALTVTFTPPYA